jgi:hypothetical protein
MLFRVGIENGNEGRSIAWALEFPGCFSYGTDGAAAEAAFPRAAASYAAWIALHGESWVVAEEILTVAEENFDVYFVDKDYELATGGGNMVESFFRYDWRPLTDVDVERARHLLKWSRKDLLKLVHGLGHEQLSRRYPDEKWDIKGIVNHIGAAEWWFQDRLGYPDPADRNDLPADPFERLTTVRDQFARLLPTLVGRNLVRGLEGELWSPRKVLRRAVWHERDHTDHIRKLLQ